MDSKQVPPEYPEPSAPPESPDLDAGSAPPVSAAPGGPLPPQASAAPGDQWPPVGATFEPGAPLPPGIFPVGYMPSAMPIARRRSTSSRLLGLGASLIAVVVIGGGLYLLRGGGGLPDAGKVVFSLKAQTDCHVSSQITEVSTDQGTLHVVGIFKDKVEASTDLKLEVLYNGVSLVNEPVDHKAVDCVDDSESLTSLPSGTYKFVFSTDKVIAEGQIDIKAP